MSPRKIQIVYILTKLELGGAQKHVLSLIEHLNPEQFDPLLVASSESAELVPYAKNILRDRLILLDSLKREVNPMEDFKAYRQICAVLKRNSADIVHTHSSKAGILGRWAAWQAKIPHIVHTIHGFGFTPEQSQWQRVGFTRLEQETAKITQRLIAVSKATLEEGSRFNIGRRAQYEWIPCGIDANEFKHISDAQTLRLKQELGIPKESPVITMVACFKPQKAPLDFVKVSAMVARRFPQVYFLMVGDGAMRPQIECLRKELKMDQRLILAGWRWDIPVILSASDGVVLTSRWEGLPLTLLEAMASGKPIVATHAGGSSEVILNGENGFLVNPGDVEGIAGALIQLLSDPLLAVAMGRSGRERLTREYDVKYMVRRIERLYRELVKICPTLQSSVLA